MHYMSDINYSVLVTQIKRPNSKVELALSDHQEFHQKKKTVNATWPFKPSATVYNKLLFSSILKCQKK